MFNINFKSHIPIYAQIVELTQNKICEGYFSEGDSLPSTRSLAAEIGVNPNTIMKAYQLLEAEDIITTRRGKGVYITAAAHKICAKNQTSAYLSEFKKLVRQLKNLNISDDQLIEIINSIYFKQTKAVQR